MQSGKDGQSGRRRGMRVFYGGFLLILLLCYIAGALSIPFVYESATLWYKVALDKTILRAGHLAGMLAVVLLFVQILLAARGRFLVEIYGLATVMRCHRINGIVTALTGCVHAGLVLAPEGFANLPIGRKFWPEMVGGMLLVILLFMAFSSQFREKLGLDYRNWRSLHKPLGYLASVLVVVHVLFVSDSFTQAVPKGALLLSFLTVAGLVLLSKISGRRSR